MPSAAAQIAFSDRDGNPVAGLSLYPEQDRLGEIETVCRINPADTAEYGEAEVQLLETAAYQYELDRKGFRLREIEGLIRSNLVHSSYDQGRITPGANVGRLDLVLLTDAGDEAGYAAVEVRAAKIGYRSEYHRMLEDISSRCADLLLEFRSPASQTVLPDDARESETLCQRFAFVKIMLSSREFRDAVSRVISLPHRLWEQEEAALPLSRGVKPTAAIARQIASASRRVPLPAGHPLAARMRSIPESVVLLRNIETIDTPENRFVKHALMTFQAFAAEIRARLQAVGRKSDSRFIEEALSLEEQLADVLNRDFFREISDPEMLPLGSPVLQRKGGYREIYAAWLKFDMAARLCWNGGPDVYGAGKRNVAALYEYWVYFRLLDIVADTYKLTRPPADSLIAETTDGFGLMLKSGQYIAIEGVYESPARRLNVKFSYNRTYSRAQGQDPETNYPESGSWTRQMRPDYTLSLWPEEFTEEEAETQELIVHVHFDAKYKVEDLTRLFGEDNGLDEEKDEQRQGIYKRGDLLKMHAYRDAIRRTAGAYVLYPGAETRKWSGYHELLPGLGAFALRPGAEGKDGSAKLSEFIRAVAEHVCDRATLREREKYHTYRIHEVPAEYRVYSPMPEFEAGKRQRHEPPAEAHVLVGWCKGEGHLKWILRKHLYNCRMDTSAGSLRLKPEISGARYLLLHGDGGKAYPGLLRLSLKGPRVISRAALLKQDYPFKPGQEHYLLFDVEPAEEFEGFEWEYKNLESRGKDRMSGWPYAVSLAELLMIRKG